MQMPHLISRARGKMRRILADQFERRSVRLGTQYPIISFTFDDAPKTAFDTGRRILEQYGARATYFVSLGILDTDTQSGRIGSLSDLMTAVSEGHELGCHTYHHLDGWETSTPAFMASVARNTEALEQILPEAKFSAFAYPKSGANLSLKRALSSRFPCLRGGGQATNEEIIDLNLLKAVFIDRWTGVDLEFIKEIVDYNAARRGWLIFVAHDVADHPSPYGCSPRFLEMVVQYAARSGAKLLPVGEACARVMGS